MPNRLADIKVDFVSFVRKAATRDPTDPSKPRRFILYKSESQPRRDSQMPTTGLLDARAIQAEYDATIAKDATAGTMLRNPDPGDGGSSERNRDWPGLDGKLASSKAARMHSS